jgi:hypothetical protein
MDSGYITACAALAGAALGGLTSFASSWTTLRVQMRAEEEASSKSRRQELYKSFIEEASRMYGDALIHDTLEVSGLIGLYALINRMRITSSRTVIEHAAWVARTITDTYNQPNKTPAELEAMIQGGGGDLLHAFSEVCRKELESNLSTQPLVFAGGVDGRRAPRRHLSDAATPFEQTRSGNPQKCE